MSKVLILQFVRKGKGTKAVCEKISHSMDFSSWEEESPPKEGPTYVTTNQAELTDNTDKSKGSWKKIIEQEY